MENDIKQKAEQLRKNAEAKIQQAQIKEQKYQQWLENQKKNNPNLGIMMKIRLSYKAMKSFSF